MADLLVGSWGVDSNGASSGQSYVVFGGPNVGTTGTIELSSLDGATGFKLNGVAAHDYSGHSVSSVGDFNGDGVLDLLIGAYRTSVSQANAGQSYVVFGGRCVGASGTVALASLDGTTGFKLNGIAASDFSGFSVSSVGDFNGDGVADLLIGAPNASPNNLSDSGQSYLVYGGPCVGKSGTIELSSLNGPTGFKINGIAAGDFSGYTVSSIEDLNDDSMSDLLIGAYKADPNGENSGQSYVVFGGPCVGASGTLELSSLAGFNGFALNGIAEKDYAGMSVSGLGDINADGVADLIIGAPDVPANGLQHSGQSYVVFGGACVGASGTIDLSNLNGANGFRLDGINAYDFSGRAVANLGDINADGVSDLIIGAPDASINESSSGQSYVILGDSVALANNQLTLTQGEVLKLTEDNLNATSINHPPDDLRFDVTYYEHGQFEYTTQPSVPIEHFTQQDIIDGRVQFAHSWERFPPAYNVTVSTNLWASTLSQAGAIHFAPLLLLRNEFTIAQGGVYLLNPGNLYATDKNVTNNNLWFTIDQSQYGQFEKCSFPGVAVKNFTQQNIFDKNIQFIADGSANVPSYSLVLSDGIYTLPPSKGNVTFYYAPSLNVNTLIISQGLSVTLNKNNLQATDRYIPTNKLTFIISAIEHGHFSLVSDPHEAITNFTQAQLSSSIVQFTQDGSIAVPSYNVSVKASNLISASQAAQIKWVTTPSEASSSNAERNILIGSLTTASIFTAMSLCYLCMGFLKNRRLQATAENKSREQKRYYREVLIPICRILFKQIKVTGLMNYISNEQAEAFVAAIGTIVNEISRLGVDIEIPYMNPEQSTELLTQIVKQIKHHLKIENSKCNKAWFTSFFKPQVTPEMISEKAITIAESVHKALLGKNETGIINIPTNLDLSDILGQASSEDGFTTGYVKMP